MKKLGKLIVLLLVFAIGFVINYKTKAEQPLSNNGWCWSADKVEEGSGYYRCHPTLSCDWIDNRSPMGEEDYCDFTF